MRDMNSLWAKFFCERLREGTETKFCGGEGGEVGGGFERGGSTGVDYSGGVGGALGGCGEEERD